MLSTSRKASRKPTRLEELKPTPLDADGVGLDNFGAWAALRLLSEGHDVDDARGRAVCRLGLVVTVEAVIVGEVCRRLRISVAGDGDPERTRGSIWYRGCFRSAQAPPSGERSSGMSSPTSRRLASSPRNGERRARFLLESAPALVRSLEAFDRCRADGVRRERDVAVTLPEPVKPTTLLVGEALLEATATASTRGSPDLDVCCLKAGVDTDSSGCACRLFRGLACEERPATARFVSRRCSWRWTRSATPASSAFVGR
jgi:hypothetical protein